MDSHHVDGACEIATLLAVHPPRGHQRIDPVDATTSPRPEGGSELGRIAANLRVREAENATDNAALDRTWIARRRNANRP